MGEEYYPDNQMTFAPAYPEDIPEHWQRFFELREDLLLNYENHNTVRAYWGDLDDWFHWAAERDKNVLMLSDRDIKQYVALLRRRRYSENTIRRRTSILRRLADRAQETSKGGPDVPIAKSSAPPLTSRGILRAREP
jgi:site-specific recombinase XerC